jgi:hypothetical protein
MALVQKKNGKEKENLKFKKKLIFTIFDPKKYIYYKLDAIINKECNSFKNA